MRDATTKYLTAYKLHVPVNELADHANNARAWRRPYRGPRGLPYLILDFAQDH